MYCFFATEAALGYTILVVVPFVPLVYLWYYEAVFLSLPELLFYSNINKVSLGGRRQNVAIVPDKTIRITNLVRD